MNIIVKNVSRIVLCICIAFAAQSCVVHKKTAHTTTKPLPPGQAKKVTGSQSAKEYAPGPAKEGNRQPICERSSRPAKEEEVTDHFLPFKLIRSIQLH
jgi:hypothetical protein